MARAWGFKCKNPDDFVGNASEGEIQVQVLDPGGDTTLLVPRGDDNREHGRKAGDGNAPHRDEQLSPVADRGGNIRKTVPGVGKGDGFHQRILGA